MKLLGQCLGSADNAQAFRAVFVSGARKVVSTDAVDELEAFGKDHFVRERVASLATRRGAWVTRGSKIVNIF